ncbi:hypothetical protein KFE25_012403 [Diacronema lutheri]|uniref:F-box domain-containing protein n=1 Tax=Diacronema lutheri TaxID=2081491 RepID=A0A8J5XTA8_DIALT|nr:hypothetical protein KFE25_012403 [Diacronema lutheri]
MAGDVDGLRDAPPHLIETLPLDLLVHILSFAELTIVVAPRAAQRPLAAPRPPDVAPQRGGCARVGGADARSSSSAHEYVWRLPAVSSVSRRARAACALTSVVLRFERVNLSASTDPPAAWHALASRVLASIDQAAAESARSAGSRVAPGAPLPPSPRCLPASPSGCVASRSPSAAVAMAAVPLAAVELLGQCDVDGCDRALRALLLPRVSRLAVVNGRTSLANSFCLSALLLGSHSPGPRPDAQPAPPAPAGARAARAPLETLIMAALHVDGAHTLWEEAARGAHLEAATASVALVPAEPGQARAAPAPAAAWRDTDARAGTPPECALARPPACLRALAPGLIAVALPNLFAPALQPATFVRALHGAHARSLRFLFLGGATLAPSAPASWAEATRTDDGDASDVLIAADADTDAGAGADADADDENDGGSATGGARGASRTPSARSLQLLPLLEALELTYWPRAEQGYVRAHAGGARTLSLELDCEHDVAALAALVSRVDGAAGQGAARRASADDGGQPSGACVRACARAALGARDASRWTPLHDAAEGWFDAGCRGWEACDVRGCASASGALALHGAGDGGDGACAAVSASARASLPPSRPALAVRRLIKLGADVDARDDKGATAAFRAAYCGRTDTLAELLAAGADPFVLNHSRESTLYIAALRGHLPSVELLARHWAGAHPERRERLLHSAYHDGSSPLHAASIARAPLIVQELLDCGFDARAVNRHAQTALHVAARVGCARCVALLVRSGGAPLASARDEHGQTVIAVARAHCPAALDALGASVEANGGVDGGALNVAAGEQPRRARERGGRRAGRRGRARRDGHAAAVGASAATAAQRVVST